jgi:hypothetical protein
MGLDFRESLALGLNGTGLLAARVGLVTFVAGLTGFFALGGAARLQTPQLPPPPEQCAQYSHVVQARQGVLP